MSELPDSIAQIDAQLAELQHKRQSLLESQKSAKREEVKLAIKQFGFTAQELGLLVRGRTPTPKGEPRYANPARPEQTWAGGKGPRPLWVKAHLAKGGDLEDLKIQ